MKKLAVWTLVFCLAWALCGCKSGSSESLSSPGSMTREEVSAWPDNAYTQVVVKPAAGTPYYVLYDAERGYYSIFLKDITMEEGKQYLQTLRENGFEPVGGDGNEVSIGEILRKGQVGLSVSVSENSLGLFITLDAEN